MGSLNQAVTWLVCYDIADPRRLGRVHRALKRTAVPVQYSVFLVRTTPVRFEWLMTELRGLIDPGADDLRAYPLTAHSLVESLGAPLWPDGVLWAEAPDARAFHFAAAPE